MTDVSAEARCSNVTREIAALAIVIAATFASPKTARADGSSWATSQAAELTNQGMAHAARGDGAAATRRLLEALSFDPTYGPAYLALGKIHEAAGDLVEAERVYTTGLERVAGFAEGHAARGKVQRRLGRLREAARDFEASLSLAPDDPLVLEGLCATYVALGALPAALAASRRMEAVAFARGDDEAFVAAHTRSRALAVLVGEVDPVAAGTYERGTVRRAIAARAAARAKR